MDAGPVEILILRAWAEPGGEPQLRIRMVLVSPGHDDRPMLTTASIDDACTAVRDWLQDIDQQVRERCS